MGFADEMQQYDDEFEHAKLSGGRLPDGEYGHAKLVESRIEHNEQKDAYSLVFKFEAEYDVPTEDGPMLVTGTVRKFYNLDHEVGRAICAEDMRRAGYQGSLSGLEDACEEGMFIDRICRIVVQTKPGTERDYTNVYINEWDTSGQSQTTPVAAATAADDDIPF
jgi:hypothetical protein